MDIQQILTLVVAAAAVAVVGRHVWAEVRALFRPNEGDGCGTCPKCDMAPPSAKTALPIHIQRARDARHKPEA